MVRRRPLLLLVMALALSGLMYAWLRATDDATRAPGEAPLAIAAAELAALSASFPAPGAGPARPPGDLAPQPAHFTESWLFAGLVRDGAGRRFGFQLVFDRLAFATEVSGRDSEWAVRDLWRALLIVEPSGGPPRGSQQLARGALGLASAEPGPARAWVEDWRFTSDDSGREIRLEASDAQFGLSLRLSRSDELPLLIESAGHHGFWQPTIEVEGRLHLDGREFEVSGSALLERLWGRTQPAGSGQLALARLWLVHEEGALRCEYLQRRAGGGTPLQDCSGISASGGPEPQLAPVNDPLRWPTRWDVVPAGAGDSLRLAPLGNAPAPLVDGSRRAVLAGQGESSAWGLLVLSNFAEP